MHTSSYTYFQGMQRSCLEFLSKIASLRSYWDGTTLRPNKRKYPVYSHKVCLISRSFCVVSWIWFWFLEFGCSFQQFVLVSLKCGSLICPGSIQILVSVLKQIHRKIKSVRCILWIRISGTALTHTFLFSYRFETNQNKTETKPSETETGFGFCKSGFWFSD